MHRICFYVSGHGFGHSARVQAVVEQILARNTGSPEAWTIELRTSAPRWFFEQLLESEMVDYSEVELEPGVIQPDSFTHDLPATLDAWVQHLDRSPKLVEREADHLRASGCVAVVADITPLACLAARRAGLPVVVMGNFTWDWILADYASADPRFLEIADAIGRFYRYAELYLKLPMSPSTDLFPLHNQREIELTARSAVRSPEEVRSKILGLEPDQIMILLSFGGFGAGKLALDRVQDLPRTRCVWDRGPGRPPHLISTKGLEVTYPELILAADLILTKPGFSIISEAVAHRTRIAYVPRSGFRESPLLESFLASRWPSIALPPESLADGSWVEAVDRFLRDSDGQTLPVIPANGAKQAAEIICEKARSAAR
jgi:L-arabinokinase